MGVKHAKRNKPSQTRKLTLNQQVFQAAPPEPYPSVANQRHQLLPKAIGLGVVTGLLAVAFRHSLTIGENMRGEWLRLAHSHGASGLACVLLVSVVATVLAAWAVARFAPEASGSGIPHLKAVLLGHRQFRWHRVIFVKFFSGLIAISTGLTLGREGPTVQMGSAVGHAFASDVNNNVDANRIFVAAGGGAGLAAAFNAPLSGLMFVLEELQKNCGSAVFFQSAVACLTADMICRQLLGQSPIYPLLIANAPPLFLLPAVIPLGAVCGILGVAFNRSLLAGQSLVVLPMSGRVCYWVGWGGVIGLVGWWGPELLGGGQAMVQQILQDQSMPKHLIALYFLMRFFLTVGSYSTGVAGGIFAPVLVLGALLGLAMADLTEQWFTLLPFEKMAFIVVGMAAFFSGVVRAPLTGMVLMIEMTASYELVLPLFLACFVAVAVADGLNDAPIYEALLKRDLQRGRNVSMTLRHQVDLFSV